MKHRTHVLKFDSLEVVLPTVLLFLPSNSRTPSASHATKLELTHPSPDRLMIARAHEGLSQGIHSGSTSQQPFCRSWQQRMIFFETDFPVVIDHEIDVSSLPG